MTAPDRPMPPSPLTLLGPVQHKAEVERNCFRWVLVGEQVPPIHDPEGDPDGPDGRFDVDPDARHAGHADHADLIRERIDGATGV